MTSAPRILIVIPALNEEDSLTEVLADLRRTVPDADVAVIDDGSMDATARVARQSSAITLVLPFNLGIGGALQTGYSYAFENGYDVAVQFDADGQHRSDQIAQLVQPVLQGQADHVIGSRLMGEGDYRFPFARRAGSWLIGLITRVVTGRRILDPTSGFRASGRRAIAFFARNYPQAYLDSPEITVWLLRQGMRVEEVPALMREADHSSVSSLRGFVHAARVCVALLIDRIEEKFQEPSPQPRRPGEESP